jgi:hypothetical protein
MRGAIPPLPQFVFMARCLVKHRDFTCRRHRLIVRSCDSSVGVTLGYGLDYRDSRVRFPKGAGNFFLHHRVQNGSGAHPASYPMGKRGSFPGGKAVVA